MALKKSRSLNAVFSASRKMQTFIISAEGAEAISPVPWRGD
jgi:hypothetical protein